MPDSGGRSSDWSEIETAVILGEMAAHVAHKLKNPLAGMMLAATRLRKLLSGKEASGRALTVVEHLCDSIGEFSRSVDETLNTGVRPELNCEPVDVNEVLSHVFELASVEVQAREAVIQHEFSSNLPRIHGDAAILRRVFSGLLSLFLNTASFPKEIRVFTGMAQLNRVSVRLECAGCNAGLERMELVMRRPFSKDGLSMADLRLCAFHRVIQLHSGAISLRPAGKSGIELTVDFPVSERKAQ